MTLNTKPKVRARIRLIARAQKCAACGTTILRGAWAWRERTGRYTCDGARCRSRVAP
jgi:hypothetical protein